MGQGTCGSVLASSHPQGGVGGRAGDGRVGSWVALQVFFSWIVNMQEVWKEEGQPCQRENEALLKHQWLRFPRHVEVPRLGVQLEL